MRPSTQQKINAETPAEEAAAYAALTAGDFTRAADRVADRIAALADRIRTLGHEAPADTLTEPFEWHGHKIVTEVCQAMADLHLGAIVTVAVAAEQAHTEARRLAAEEQS